MIEKQTEYIKASLQYGHSLKEFNPKMAPYILGSKAGFHIFDLVKTSKLLHHAGYILEKKAEKGGSFLFVGTNTLVSSSIANHAKDCQSFYINYRWLGGLFTNWSTVKKQILLLKQLEHEELKNHWIILSKKDLAEKQKKIHRLRKLFQGIKEMKSLPEVVIFTNQLKDTLALKECLRQGITAICIADSNCDPFLAPYIIPANDDSISSINFILTFLATKILAGYKKKKVIYYKTTR